MKSPSLPPLPANVLLAEDDRDNRIIISTWLRRMGAHVDIAENGRVAVETALAALTEDNPYDVVLMDMQMPELDGYGATFQLRSCGYKGLVVAFTAHAMDRDQAVCLSLGCDDYLSKPIDRTRLRAVLEKSLAARTTAAAARPANDSSDDDGKDLETVTAEFAAMLPDRARTIARAIAENEVAHASHLLHQLRGSAGSYGFASVSDAAADVESALSASAGEDDIRAVVGELLSACRLVAA
jgi:CheY-like chemotaxis protein/HPt (histidine-containing phosphotransfer) domain-containing protein